MSGVAINLKNIFRTRHPIIPMSGVNIDTRHPMFQTSGATRQIMRALQKILRQIDGHYINLKF